MPLINADSMESHTCSGGAFAYSASSIDHLDASEYTLVTIAVDASGSVSGFKAELEACVATCIEACKLDPRAEFVQVRTLIFADDVRELHGFRPLAQCQESDYRDFLTPGGMTALFEAACDGIESEGDFAVKLYERDYTSNGVLFVVTDGCDNQGAKRGLTAASVKEALARAVQSERLESMLAVLVGVNMRDPAIRGTLARVEIDGGFSQFLPIEDASAKSLAKLGQFMSASISAQSQALGSGGPSKPLTF